MTARKHSPELATGRTRIASCMATADLWHRLSPGVPALSPGRSPLPCSQAFVPMPTWLPHASAHAASLPKQQVMAHLADHGQVGQVVQVAVLQAGSRLPQALHKAPPGQLSHQLGLHLWVLADQVAATLPCVSSLGAPLFGKCSTAGLQRYTSSSMGTRGQPACNVVSMSPVCWAPTWSR